jgi:AhpD family alkylhydroperoxidase
MAQARLLALRLTVLDGNWFVRHLAMARLLALKLSVIDRLSTEPQKASELAAIGVCIASGCQSCLQWHAARAVDCGATIDDLVEAVESGLEISGGRSMRSTRLALGAVSAAFAAHHGSPRAAAAAGRSCAQLKGGAP